MTPAPWRRAAALAVALAALLTAAPASAALTFRLVADTSALAGRSGYLDFQLNQAGDAAPALTARVANFAAGGGTLGDLSVIGNASGSLPAGLTLGNDPGFNDAFQAITFGAGAIAFDLILSGPGVDDPNASPLQGSSFSFSLYQADGMTPYSTGSNGSAVTIDVLTGTPPATATAAVYAGGPPATALAVSGAVPEPSSAALVAFGIAAAATYRRARRRAAR